MGLDTAFVGKTSKGFEIVPNTTLPADKTTPVPPPLPKNVSKNKTAKDSQVLNGRGMQPKNDKGFSDP